MKRISRILGVFLCLALVLSGKSFAATATPIDISHASEGYFTVEYAADANLKMKVGVTYNGNVTYYDYVPGTVASYALTSGNGYYNIALYRHVSGTSYAYVTGVNIYVELKDAMAPYLVSTTEITFAANDAVGKKAAQICKGLTNDKAKIVAINNYIAKNYKYNFVFASSVRRGTIKNYTPNTNELLTKQRGVCYDFSALFAAMCRSQGIPCAMAKGYQSGAYHAWNMVYVDGNWVAIDLTNTITQRLPQAKSLSDCSVSLASYYGYTY